MVWHGCYYRQLLVKNKAIRNSDETSVLELVSIISHGNVIPENWFFIFGVRKSN